MLAETGFSIHVLDFLPKTALVFVETKIRPLSFPREPQTHT